MVSLESLSSSSSMSLTPNPSSLEMKEREVVLDARLWSLVVLIMLNEMSAVEEPPPSNRQSRLRLIGIISNDEFISHLVKGHPNTSARVRMCIPTLLVKGPCPRII